MRILALDMSKTSTGYAFWHPGLDLPRFGHWELGSVFTDDGMVFSKLYRNLADLYAVAAFDYLYVEQTINPVQLAGHTTISIINMLAGLRATALQFAHDYRMRIVKEVALDHWRPAFVGRMEVNDAKAAARRARKEGNQKASAREDLKALCMARCRQLGMKPARDDEADAIGILDYACDLLGIIPNWRANETLRPILTGAPA